MRTSMRQVAERAGVSAMTVSRVLRGQHNLVSEETRTRILAAVEEMKYVPVRPAMQNRHVETHVIGLVPYYVNFSQHSLDAVTYEGICEGARQYGYDLLVMLRSEADWMANRQEVRFLDRRSDGFIFISTGTGEWQEALLALRDHEIPTVVCYRRDVPEGVAWVDPDNAAIVRLALECLRRQGHRRVAYLTGAKQLPSEQPRFVLPGEWHNHDDRERAAEFERLVQEQGFEAHCVVRGGTPDWRLAPEALPQLRDEGITGVVCLNDLLALRLWDAAQAQHWRVPQDLSIVGVDNTTSAERRGLTSVAFGYDEVGHLAVEAWMALRRGASAAEASRFVPVRLVERFSVGPPRGE